MVETRENVKVLHFPPPQFCIRFDPTVRVTMICGSSPQATDNADGDGDYEISEGEVEDDEATLEEEERRARESGGVTAEAEVRLSKPLVCVPFIHLTGYCYSVGLFLQESASEYGSIEFLFKTLQSFSSSVSYMHRLAPFESSRIQKGHRRIFFRPNIQVYVLR